ncbi:MAG: hypothetical protein RJA44_2446 [Pseudomonadota bacterium]
MTAVPPPAPAEHAAAPLHPLLVQPLRRMLWLLCLSVLLVSASLGAWILNERESIEYKTHRELEISAVLLENYARQSLQTVDTGLRSTQDLIAEIGLDGLRRQAGWRQLKVLSQFMKGAGEIFVYDLRGDTVATSAQFPAMSFNASDRQYFKDLLAGAPEPYIGNALKGRTVHKYFFPVARTVRDAEGRIQGVVQIGVSMDFVNEIFRHANAGSSQVAGLYRLGDGAVVARDPVDPALLTERLTLPGGVALAGGLDKAWSGPGAAETGSGWMVLRRIEGWPLVVRRSIGAEPMVSPADQGALRWWLLLVALGGGSYVLLGWLVVRGMTSASRLVAQTEQRLRQDKSDALIELARFEAIVRSSEDAIIGKALDGRITSWNAGAERLYGYSAEEMLGQPVTCLFPPELIQDEMDLLRRVHAGEQIHPFDTRRLRKDGRIIDVSVTISPIRDEQGRIVGASKIARDITAAKRTAEELARAKLQAEAASAAKSRFLAVMSHEIRTPLNAIIGMSYLLEQGTTSVTQREQLGTITAAGNSLLAQINGLLDFSKIEAGELILEQLHFRLADLIDESSRMFGPQARSRHLLLQWPERWDELPNWVVGDRQKLQQMLANLINNALKFTPVGAVTVAIEELDRQAGRVRLRLSVSDTGIGVPADVIPTLFRPFVQADASITRTHGGTGLGLALVHELARCMGGSTGVESVPGQGSRFWFEVELGLPDEGDAEHSAAAQPGRRRLLQILAADDEPTEREWFSSTAERLGWQSEVVADGPRLIEAVVERVERRQPLDCVLLDWRMPGMDGLAALAELHRRIEPQRMPAVVMVTAAERRELEQALDRQAVAPDSILTKPVKLSLLFNTVNEAVIAHGLNHDFVLQGTQLQDHGNLWLAGLEILVVDDSRLNLEVCGRLLCHEGAVPTLCESAADALAQFEARPQHFDAILMDIHMPDIDGFQATRQLRERLQGRQLPIIALTAGAMASEREEAFASGVDDFLTKPIEPQQLVRVLRRLVEATRGCSLTVQPRQPARADAEPTEESRWPALTGLDTAGARARFAGDLPLFLDLLGRFEQEAPGLLDRAEREWQAGDRAQAAARLHRFRGQAGNLGAIDLQQAAGALEVQARAARLDLAELARCRTVLQGFLAEVSAWRAAEAAQTPATPPPAGAVSSLARADLELLLAQIDAHELAALDTCNRLAAGLRHLLGPEPYARLRDAMQMLDFPAARNLLEPLARSD